MRALTLVLLAVLAVNVSAERKNWVLLIAGSDSYDNYRHQADVCHAYQIMHKAGIPDEQIVVMMFDDIANNPSNPYKGNIINELGGPNVYPGVPKDYTQNEVNARNFLAVLQGNKEEVRRLTGRNGKVIDSGPDDYIFIYYVGHGGPCVLGMPYPPYVKARELINALQSMHDKKRFAKLTFYVESRAAGSVFADLLPRNISVYVTTSANTHETSYACYWDDSRYTFLGDTYSVNWMEDTDGADLHNETFEQQYEIVKKYTPKSHVMQYGDLSIDKLVLEKFFGENKQESKFRATKKAAPIDQVPSEAVTLRTLKYRIQAAPANSEKRLSLKRKLADLQQTMLRTHDLIWDIARTTYDTIPEKQVYDLTMKKRESILDWDCYETVVDTLLDFCPGLDITKNDFALEKFFVLVNLCNNKPVGKIVSALESVSVVNPLCRI